MGSYARPGVALSALAALLASGRRSLAPIDSQEAESSLHPDTVFRTIAAEPYPVYLWGHAGHDRGRFSIVTHSPFAVIEPCPGGVLIRAGSRRVRLPGDGVALCMRLVGEMPAIGSDLPFCGGAIGYVSFEQSLEYVGLSSRHAHGPLPAFHFAFYDHAFVFDHDRDRGAWVGEARAPHASRSGKPRAAGRAAHLGAWTASVGEAQYLNHVAQIQDRIDAGDIYQANYTARLSAPGWVDFVELALRLKSQNPAPMGACLRYPFGTVWSSSPERLLSGQLHGTVTSVPIKGTRRRDPHPPADKKQVEELLRDPKERAELLMIVDLVRNDLGRVAEIGSVTVDELYRIQSYANVHHLEATVSAQMSAAVAWDRVLAAVLPGGSITGAPKRRAAEILQELEPVPRSVYTGALGYLSFSGHADFSIPIRTLYHDGTHFHLHSGGGIVADSDPAREYAEFQLKVANIQAILDEACRSI